MRLYTCPCNDKFVYVSPLSYDLHKTSECHRKWKASRHCDFNWELFMI